MTAMPTLLAYYSHIKATHVSLVALSGILFTARGLAVLWGARWPMQKSTRVLSQCIDSALLLAALVLLAALHGHPLSLPWLRIKLGLLLAYIAFGTLALRRAPGRTAKAGAFALALLCFAAMVALARTRNPWFFVQWL